MKTKEITHQVCTCCGGNKPVSAYYDYRATGGKLFQRCKECIGKKVHTAYHADKRLDADNIIQFLKCIQRKKRSYALYSRVREGRIDSTTFQTVVQMCVAGEIKF